MSELLDGARERLAAEGQSHGTLAPATVEQPWSDRTEPRPSAGSLDARDDIRTW